MQSSTRRNCLPVVAVCSTHSRECKVKDVSHTAEGERVQLLEKTQDMHKSIYQSKAPDAGNRSRTGGSSESAFLVLKTESD
jgi:hypothetical protein